MIALKDSLGTEFVERIRAIFSENGQLSKAKNFEFRPQQQEMAAAVARVLEEQRHLVVEAGTGVGKSLAYLTPAILFALEQHKKAIVSTHTINLQEQLLYKDIPILKKVLPIEFDAALMKGRQNYLCPRRLERALQSSKELFTGPEDNELNRIAEWASKTLDGSLSDLSIEPDPKVWTQVCSEAHICTQKTCGQNSRCFYLQARKRLLAADLIVLNHTLLFMLLGSPAEQESLKAELQEFGRRIRHARDGIALFLEQSAPQHVYWVERTGKTAQFLSLNAAPIDLAPVLRRMIFRDNCCSVMTSATLAVGREDLAYFRERIGATEAEPLQLGSPFDFQKQMKLFVVRKMPDPRDPGYAKELERWIAHFVEQTDGAAFVLFTSYRDMQQVAGEMQKFFAEKNFNLLLQGGGTPRTKL